MRFFAIAVLRTVAIAHPQHSADGQAQPSAVTAIAKNRIV